MMTSAQDQWVARILGVDAAARRPDELARRDDEPVEPPAAHNGASTPAQADPDKLGNILAFIFLRIPEYSSSGAQHEDWLARAEAAQALLRNGDIAAAATAIQTLGAEMTKAAEALPKDPAVRLRRMQQDWQGACGESLRETATLQSRYVAILESSRRNTPAVVKHVAAQWDEIGRQIRELETTIDKACAASVAALRAGKPILLGRAVKSAEAAIAGSPLLANVDRNGVMETAIVARLGRELSRLAAFKGAGS